MSHTPEHPKLTNQLTPTGLRPSDLDQALAEMQHPETLSDYTPLGALQHLQDLRNQAKQSPTN